MKLFRRFAKSIEKQQLYFMVNLKQTLNLREELIKEKEELRERLEITKGRLSAINSLLEGFGVEHFVYYEKGNDFMPKVNPKKNKGFFK